MEAVAACAVAALWLAKAGAGGEKALAPVRVHVALDSRGSSPSWLRKDFEKTGAVLRADHWTFDLSSRDCPAGIIELGGSTDDGRVGGKGNYLVVLEPVPLPAPATPTGIEAVLAMPNQGDAQRGEWLFHATGGAGCFQCHRLTGSGKAFGPDLSPRHMVDLAAYLLTQTSVPASLVRGGAAAGPDPTTQPMASTDAKEGFHWLEQSDRLVVVHSARPVAEFVFRDARILRPHLANVRAPDGTQVTRSHPPVPGTDATDHDTMHPGLWLAFGDISRVDFWRIEWEATFRSDAGDTTFGGRPGDWRWQLPCGLCRVRTPGLQKLGLFLAADSRSFRNWQLPLPPQFHGVGGSSFQGQAAWLGCDGCFWG